MLGFFLVCNFIFNFSLLYQDAFHLKGYMCVHLFEMGTAFSKFSLAPCGFSVFLVGFFYYSKFFDKLVSAEISEIKFLGKMLEEIQMVQILFVGW